MSIYSSVPIKKPGRNAFNLSHSFRGCLNIGELKPIGRPIEAVPGDTFITGNISRVELSPIVSQFFGELNFETWQFFVSNDSLYKSSDSGKFTDILASLTDPQNVLPLPYISLQQYNSRNSVIAYLYGNIMQNSAININKHLLVYPERAYTKIWNEWFRDENLQNEVPYLYGDTILKVNYKKDRFTSVFLTTQKGNEIRFNIGTQASIIPKPQTLNFSDLFGYGTSSAALYANPNAPTSGDLYSPFIALFSDGDGGEAQANAGQRLLNLIKNGFVVDLANSTRGITINDLRLYDRLQKWQERNQLCGTRIKEYLLSNYGVAPNDETLDRPVLIGHTVAPVVVDPIISNIKQTNQSLLPLQNEQGSRGGVASASSSFKYGKWFCKEFGWIITLGALRPKSSYYQGVHKSLRKDSIVSFFNPIFEHLGQQEVRMSEIFFTNTSADDKILGYQDIYNEMRHIEDFTAPDLAIDYENKTMFRKFANEPSAASILPVLPTDYDYLFAIPSTNAPQAFFTSYNVIKAIRPISKRSTPRL